MIKDKDFQGKRHESCIAKNGHLEHMPEVEIRERIFPVGTSPEIKQLPQKTGHKTGQNPTPNP
jgi:hypothetical protein